MKNSSKNWHLFAMYVIFLIIGLSCITGGLYVILCRKSYGIMGTAVLTAIAALILRMLWSFIERAKSHDREVAELYRRLYLSKNRPTQEIEDIKKRLIELGENEKYF